MSDKPTKDEWLEEYRSIMIDAIINQITGTKNSPDLEERFIRLKEGYEGLDEDLARAEEESTVENQQQTENNNENSMSTVTENRTTKSNANTTEFKDVLVVRKGTQIILPENMTYAEGRLWLTRKEEAEEKTVAIHNEIECYPLDGLIALSKAMQEIYGFTSLQGDRSFFGEQPPLIIQVPDHNGKLHSAPMGKMLAPTWEGGYLETQIGFAPKLVISGQVKRKHEDEVKRVINRARELVLTDSLYKGHAIHIDLSWMDGSRRFDPIKDSPTFMKVSDLSKEQLILNKDTEFDISTNIWMLISQTKACIANGIPLKQGVLLAGPYGTGKTMTAKVTANIAEQHGWTFIYLKDVQHIAKALKLAEMYAPAVLFAEDIDQAASGQRTDALNEILNTLDGVDTKGKPIITVLTTNHQERLSPAFMRAGRIDTIVDFGTPDAESAKRFVQLYGRTSDGQSLLKAGIDLGPVGESLAGFVPAFIAEAVQKAKRAAIFREGADITGKVTSDDLIGAASSLKAHAELTKGRTELTPEQVVADAVATLNAVYSNRDIEVNPRASSAH